MYSHKFATRALEILRADVVAAKERVYEKVRSQMAGCRAHVVVNGKAYKYGCIHASEEDTVKHVKVLYGANLDKLNEELGLSVPSWDDVHSQALVDAVQSSMVASTALLERTRGEPGNEQSHLESILSTLLSDLEKEKQIQTCCRECSRCEGDTIETHFACLAMHNRHIPLEDWYILLLGFLVHSVQQGDFLPYYSRNVHVPDEDAVNELLAWLGGKRWSQTEQNYALESLGAVWGLQSPPTTVQDVIHMIPPTSCYTFDKFKNIVEAMPASFHDSSK